jgi:hypothetical protein
MPLQKGNDHVIVVNLHRMLIMDVMLVVITFDRIKSRFFMLDVSLERYKSHVVQTENLPEYCYTLCKR